MRLLPRVTADLTRDAADSVIGRHLSISAKPPKPVLRSSPTQSTYVVCMCSRPFSARDAISCVRKCSELYFSRTWRTRTPGMACFADFAGAYISDRFFVHCLFPVAGHSLHCFRTLESTPDYRDPASADWRICPTSFEPCQRTTDATWAGAWAPWACRLIARHIDWTTSQVRPIAPNEHPENHSL